MHAHVCACARVRAHTHTHDSPEAEHKVRVGSLNHLQRSVLAMNRVLRMETCRNWEEKQLPSGKR